MHILQVVRDGAVLRDRIWSNNLEYLLYKRIQAYQNVECPKQEQLHGRPKVKNLCQIITSFLCTKNKYQASQQSTNIEAK